MTVLILWPHQIITIQVFMYALALHHWRETCPDLVAPIRLVSHPYGNVFSMRAQSAVKGVGYTTLVFMNAFKFYILNNV